jgi:lipopolysaccharide/colanic/teichoic acid biosynthesis glycosyltransferase
VFLLLAAGIVAIVLGFSKIHAKYVAELPYDFTGSARFTWAIAYIVLLILASYSVGLPDLPRTMRSALLTSLGAGILGALGISAVQLLTGDALLPRFVVFASALAMVPWGGFCYLLTGRKDESSVRDRVVVVAEVDEQRQITDDVERDLERPAVVALLLAPSELSSDRAGEPLAERLREAGGTVLVLSRSAQADERIVTQAGDLHESGVRVRTLAQFYEEWMAKLPVGELERMSLMFDIGEVHETSYGRLKRLMDLSIALVAFVPFLLMLPIALIGNLFANRGPLFYSQPRVGKNDEVFQIRKLRTMTPSTGPTEWTAESDPRITPFGRFLRKSHLDELPQVLNVFRGDLSIVGPRPEQPRYVKELEEKLPFYHLRHLVRPGITGWAQVKYPYGATEEDALEKLQYEFFYLRHQSLSLDVRCIVRTLRSVVRGGGR